MFPSSIAKSIVGALVTAGAAFLGSQLHVAIPADVQGWLTDAITVVVVGAIGGGAVWAVPNVGTNTKKKK